MFPLYDDIPSRYRPIAGRFILAINVVLFVIELWLMAEGRLDEFLLQFAVIPAREAAAFSAVLTGDILALPGLLLPIVVAMFLHGGILHIGGNMLFLWIFGDNVEDLMGHSRFTVFYLLCGIGATAAQIAIEPASVVPNIGASGAIAGVLAAYLINYPKARVQTIIPLGFLIVPFKVPAVVYLPIWFGLQTLSGLASLGMNTSVNAGGIAYFAHVGGFISGLVLVRPFQMRRSLQALF